MQYRIIYVAAALTNASSSMKQSLPYFKQILRDRTESIVLRWVGMETEITEGFYERDIGNVKMCDVMIAIIDEPSIGVGIEIAYAIQERKPILCLHSAHTAVSRMIRAASIEGYLTLAEYKDIHDAADIAANFVKESVSTVEA